MADSTVVGLHYATQELIEFRIRDGVIAAVENASDEKVGLDSLEWIGPAFWDIQTNGRWGISFSDEGLTVEQVRAIVLANAGLGTARLCPTLITASHSAMLQGTRTIAAACDQDPEIARMVLGLHLEGPYIAPADGYRGAHPLDAVRDPDWSEFEALQEAAGGRIALMTLAPERPGAIEFIRKATAAGVVIALAHTAAEPAELKAAVEAGARLSTHLGNGIAATLPRHPNAIWTQAADDRAYASLIADGHHLDLDVLRVLVRAKRVDRVILVSDASPLAGLPPETYGPWAVDPSGKIVVAGTPYLAGSNQGLDVGLGHLAEVTGWSLAEVFATVTRNPARLLGRPEPRLAVGEPANLVRFRRRGSRIELVATCVDGVWLEPSFADQRTAALTGA